MSVIREHHTGVRAYLARTCADFSAEAIPERDPEFRLPANAAVTEAELGELLSTLRLLRTAAKFGLIPR
jgi:hypothetical protein